MSLLQIVEPLYLFGRSARQQKRSEHLTEGRILLNGSAIAAPAKKSVPGPDRMVVFQQGGLFPWMRALENVSRSLRDDGFVRSLRQATSRDVVWGLLSEADHQTP